MQPAVSLLPDEGESQPSGLRELKKRRTRTALQRAALELFEARGFDAVTVDEIAAAVEVSPRTFYRYYPAKEDVLVDIARDERSKFLTAIRDRPRDEEPLEAIRNAYLVVSASQDEHQLRIWARVVRQAPGAIQDVTADIERMIADAIIGRSRNSDPVRSLAAAAAFQAVIRVALDSWLDDNDTATLDERLRDLLTALRPDFMDLRPRRGGTRRRAVAATKRKSARIL